MADLGRSHGVQIDFECRRRLRLSGFATFFLGTKTPSPRQRGGMPAWKSLELSRRWNRAVPRLLQWNRGLYRSSERAKATVGAMNLINRRENGKHDFWTHFWFGLTLGGAFGSLVACACATATASLSSIITLDDRTRGWLGLPGHKSATDWASGPVAPPGIAMIRASRQPSQGKPRAPRSTRPFRGEPTIIPGPIMRADFRPETRASTNLRDRPSREGATHTIIQEFPATVSAAFGSSVGCMPNACRS
jgi:hypothetical protein